jgi:acetyltransferase EpsM
MSEALQVVVPLLNPNEPEAQLNACHVRNGQYVEAGEPLFTLETTKSVHEVTAERAGYVVALEILPGRRVHAGALLCWLADDPDWQAPITGQLTSEAADDQPSGLRITEPARRLAEQLGVELTQFPEGPLITEMMVEAIAFDVNLIGTDRPEGAFDPDSVVVYGGGGHGRSVIDLLRLLDRYTIVGVIDDGISSGEEVMGVPVLGDAGMLHELSGKGIRLAVNAVGGIGDVRSRIRVFQHLIHAGFGFPARVHPSAFVEPSAVLMPGTQVFPQAYVGSEASIGFGGIVNTGAVISHDCSLAAYVNIAPGALIAGGVSIGESALVGMGVTINLNVTIGAGAQIGNSAVIKADVPEGQVVRAGRIWPDTHGA